jgi:hypothetical protein
LISLAGATKEAQPPWRINTWGITGNGLKIVETTRDKELIGRDKPGKAAVGEVWVRGPPHQYTTARPDEIKDPIAPRSGGGEAVRMGQTEWGEREHQDGKI